MMGSWVPLSVWRGPSLTSEARLVVVEDLFVSAVDKRDDEAYL